MVYQSKREYLEKIRNRYAHAGRRYKHKILDEFCAICGYHRKHAIRLLRQQSSTCRHRPGPASLYTDDIKAILKYFWLATNRLCSKLLKAALPLWLPYYPLDLMMNLASGTDPDKIKSLLFATNTS